MAEAQVYGEIKEIIDGVEKIFWGLQKFGVVPSPPIDHHYFIHKKPTRRINGKSFLIDKIRRDWEVLRLCLTDSSIYVRAYETRPDLMRAMIKGPQGTPYYHALFCFDIRFPSNYPNQPPKLFYYSYGHDLNPNLNKTGKVNLTALVGDKGHWNFKGKSYPKPFKIFDVLASIQNTILNSNPYLDETPHASEKRYSKDVLMQTWEAMLCMLKSPPRDFEIFVKGHFRTHAHLILMKYKSHMGSDETMSRLFFKLIRAFEANGTYCQHHYNKHSYDQALLEEEKPLNSCSVSKVENTLLF